MNISMLAAKYLRQNRRLRTSTKQLTEKAIAHLIEAAGDLEIELLAFRHAEEFQNYLLDCGCRKTSADIYVRSVRPVFTWAVRRGLIAKNPFAEIDLFRPPLEVKGVFPEAEITAMLTKCNTLWRARILLGCCCGLRRGEVLNLTIRDIDLEGNYLTVQTKEEGDSTWAWVPKGKLARRVPMPAEVARLLSSLIHEMPEGQPYPLISASRYKHLLELKKGGRLTDRVRSCPDDNFTRHFAGITDKQSFHGLRRTAITKWLENGIPPHVVQRVAGHASIQTTTDHYAYLQDAQLDKLRLASSFAQ